MESRIALKHTKITFSKVQPVLWMNGKRKKYLQASYQLLNLRLMKNSMLELINQNKFLMLSAQA